MLLRRRWTGRQVLTVRTDAGHVQRHVRVRLGERVHRAGGYLQFVQVAQVVVAVVEVERVVGREEHIFVQLLVVSVLLIVVEMQRQLIVAGHQIAARPPVVQLLG